MTLTRTHPHPHSHPHSHAQTSSDDRPDGRAPASDRQVRVVAKALRTRSFAVLATVSPDGRPHSAGVVYDLVDGGELGGIAGHGVMDMAGACFVRVVPHGTMHSFGAGVPILDLARDPLGSGGRSVSASAVLANL